MNLIKNAIVYRATLPTAEALAEHLAEKPFTPVLESHYSSSGFIVHPTTDELVSTFPGGLAFRLRRDFKPVSKAAIKLALAEQVAARAAELGRDLAKEEADELLVAITTEVLKNTLPERAELDAFYHIESRTLLLPTTNRDMANAMLAQLVEACGAVETSTIHVSDVKGGLTTRLRNYFEQDDKEAFAGFKIGDSVLMKGKQGRASFDLDNLDHARLGVIEALNGEMQAERLELCHADAVNFKLTKEFQLRGISYLGDELEEEPDFDTAAEMWRHTAGVQTLLLVATVNALCDLFGYQEKEATTDGQQATATAEPDEADPLYAAGVEFVRESGRASVSAVQRKLKIGYNRSARMVEEMERQGVVTPINGLSVFRVVAGKAQS
jgi:recombination associated protein RdgC